MDNNIVNTEILIRLRELIAGAGKVAITAHISPDGDAIGSSLALMHLLKAMGKEVNVVVPDDYPKQLSFLPGIHEVVIFCKNLKKAKECLSNADLIFCLDYNAIQRIDRMAPVLLDSPANKILIDHHIDPSDFCTVTVSYPEKSSTCMLLFQVLWQLGMYDMMPLESATCITAGMMTDTGNFTYNANDPEIYEVLALLMKKGVDRDELSRLLFNVFSESCLRLNGYAISKMHLWRDEGAALITLTREELNRFHYSRGDTEGLVNKPLSIPGIIYSVFLREEERYIKVSMRSVGDFPCNEICEKHFNGGGHKNAAGGEFYGSMEQAVTVFKSIIQENKKLYKVKNNKKQK